MNDYMVSVKKVDGREVEIPYMFDPALFGCVLWVAWADIKPILDELQGELARYQAAIENEQVGCSDYGLMK